jgi:hypothetical protein
MRSFRDESIPSCTRLCQGLSSLVVTQISLRGTPESLIPWPTSCSLPYASALGLVSLGVPFSLSFKFYSRVNVAITSLQRSFDRFSNLIGLRLPSSETNTRHLVPSVEGEDLPADGESVRWAARGSSVLTWSLDQLRMLSWWMSI